MQAAPMSNCKVEAKNLCTACLKLKAMKTNNSCVLAFEKCSYQLSLWFTVHNVIIEEVNKVEDIERRHNCTHNVRTENRLPIKHIIGALQPHSHSYTATHTPSQQEVGPLNPPYPLPIEACCSDNCSPKLMTSPGALVCVCVCVCVLVCVCVYVCVCGVDNRKRCISLTMKEQ